jgi:hypothetical protein
MSHDSTAIEKISDNLLQLDDDKNPTKGDRTWQDI